ncbi:MAG: S-layer homology domain-containing protein [Solibacillus sp.]
MKKLFFVLVLLISCMNSQTPASAATFFSDVPSSHYAFDAIKWAKQVELIGGYPDGTFKPNQKVSEQQFAHMLVTYFDLDETEEELLKNTPTEKASDVIYNNLATYGVPLNGYFDNNIRGGNVTRGVVAQALGYIVDGQTTLDGSITFLIDAYISIGQNEKYKERDLAKYFGADNTLTRGQAVILFYRLSEKNYFYISNIAQESVENVDEKSIMTRAREARSMVHADFAKGSDYTNPKEKDKNLLAWNGLYSFTQRYGDDSFDVRGLELQITNTDKTTMYIELQVYDGLKSNFVEGTATLLTENKAMLSETIDGNRCMIEFQKLDQAVRIVELDCAYERDSELTYTGVVKKN